jgi:hypothetical protein
MLLAASWIEGERGVLSVLELTTEPELSSDDRAQQRRQRTDALRSQLATDDIREHT